MTVWSWCDYKWQLSYLNLPLKYPEAISSETCGWNPYLPGSFRSVVLTPGQCGQCFVATFHSKPKTRRAVWENHNLSSSPLLPAPWLHCHCCCCYAVVHTCCSASPPPPPRSLQHLLLLHENKHLLPSPPSSLRGQILNTYQQCCRHLQQVSKTVKLSP
jgi:hypothetical protein